LFLDIHLPDSDGITLAKKLRDLGYCNEIVFLTVASDKMLSAFDVGAYNYIIKDNTTDERFKYVVTSAIETARQQRDAYMLFSAGGENINVPVRDIMYFEVVNRIIVVHYGDQTFEFFSTIGKLENRLRSYGFVRIHRSILVAKAYIRDFTYREVTLINGEQLPVSRGKYALLKEAMADE
jgi:two-component system response regulator LytT